MLLLEFPTEVFAHVVFFVVTDLGVEEAMKARSVCRTFANCIKEEILCNQPNAALEHQNAVYSHRKGVKKLIANHMSCFVFFCTMKKLAGVNEDLPSAIKRVADFFLPFEALATNEDQQEKLAGFVEEICGLAGKLSPNHVFNVLKRGIRSPCRILLEGYHYHVDMSQPERDMVDKLVVSVYLGNIAAITECLQAGTQLWSCSYPFGYSLTVAAVYAQNPSTVSYILDNLSQSMDTDDTACLQAIYGMFHDAITTSFRRGNPAMATSLLEWFSENVPMPRKEVYNSWLGCAIRSKDACAITATLNMEVNGSKVIWDNFECALRTGYAPTIAILIEKGKFCIDRYYHDTSPLALAARYTKWDIVRELLDHGANPNGPPNPKDTFRRPLRYAIEKQSLETVELLFNRGAKLNSCFGHGEIARLLQMAAPEVLTTTTTTKRTKSGTSKVYHNVVRTKGPIYHRVRRAMNEEAAAASLSQFGAANNPSFL